MRKIKELYSNIIEHYGKVVVALLCVVAACLIAGLVIEITSNKTTEAVNELEYEDSAKDAVLEGMNKATEGSAETEAGTTN